MKDSTVLVAALALGLGTAPTAAQERASGFWGGVDLGAATSPPGVAQDQRFRAVTFRIGLTYR